MVRLRNRLLLLGIAVSVLLLAAGAYIYFHSQIFTKPNKAITAVPDLSGMEPQVAEKIRKLSLQVEQHPASAEAWGRLGMTLDAHGLKDEAISRYRKAAELAPNDFRWPYYCAINLKEAGSLESLSWFQKAEALNNSYLPLQIRHARALSDFGRTEEARLHFVQALKINARSAEAYAGLAQNAISHGDLQIAKELAAKAIVFKPDLAEAYHIMALACRRTGDADGAQKAIEKTRELPEKTGLVDPVYAALASEGISAYWYRTRGRTYLESGLYELAYQQYQTALKLKPDAEAHDNLGVALQGMRRWDEAIEYHKKAIAMNPGYLNYYNLAIAYAKSGNLQDAIKAFHKSLEFNNDNADCHYNLGVAYFKLRRYAESIEQLQKAIHIKPSYAEAHFALGMSYIANEEPMKAREEYELLLKIDPALAARLIAR